MSETRLGEIIEAGERRDAIHIAVAPVIASQRLAPGDHVGFVSADQETVGVTDKPLGIVDPFLKTTVLKGERFWLFLYPATISSLRHEWTHPAFEAPKPVTAKAKSKAVDSAKERIQAIADELGISYTLLMAAAYRWLNTGDIEVQRGSESWRSEFPSCCVEFWAAYEIVQDQKVPEDKKTSFFCCTC